MYGVALLHLFSQIYNETVRNLLGPSSAGILDLREDAHGATIVSGLTELEVKDSEEVMTLLHRGNLRRTCEPTAVNKTSSRSHAILKVRVGITEDLRAMLDVGVPCAGDCGGTQSCYEHMSEGSHWSPIHD